MSHTRSHSSLALSSAVMTAVFVAALSGASCKPLRPESELKTDRGDQPSGAYKIDSAAAAEAARIRGACDGKPKALFRGTGAGDRVDFTPFSAAERVADDKQVQPAFYEEARYRDGRWHLSAPVIAPGGNNAGCLAGVTVLTTGELAAALGCDAAFRCQPADDICAGGECLASLGEQQIRTGDFEQGPGASGSQETGLALTDGSSGPVRCRQTGSDWHLQSTSGQVIGNPLTEESVCNALAATASQDLVCAWSGSAILPARLSDGAFVGGDQTLGAKTLERCAAMIATANGGVVCSWTGRAYAPYSYRNSVRVVGTGSFAPVLGPCSEMTSVVEADRVCSMADSGISIFSVKNSQPDAELGSFESFRHCGEALRLTATSDGRKDYLALVRSSRASAPDLSPDKPETGGLSLLNEGWTWGDCNDPQREYHLVARSGSQLVCGNKIDTLYSWGPSAKITWLKNQPWSGRMRRDGKNAPVFTTQSSYATYGYGQYAIRFKIRSDARFRFFDNVAAYSVCDHLSDAEVDNTVAVRWWKIGELTGTDWILCGAGPVHSWSYGTRDHHKEMTRETAWINANNYRNFELYVKRDAVDTIPPKLDGNSFTAAIWQANLSRHVAQIPGQLIYNPDVPDKTPTAHFSTRWSSYINQGGGGANAGGAEPPGGGNAGGAGGMSHLTFIGARFRDGSGRTLWLDANRACSMKRASGSPEACRWGFSPPATIEVTRSNNARWYYSAQSADTICFTNEDSPGHSCQGTMTRYTP